MLATTLARLEDLALVFGIMILGWIYGPKVLFWLFSQDRVWRKER